MRMKLQSKPQKSKRIYPFLAQVLSLERKCLGRYSSFLVKFVIFSTALYLLWTLIAPAYFSAILKITAAYFKLIGIKVSLPTPDSLYSEGILSYIPPFIALVLATPGIKWRKVAS